MQICLKKYVLISLGWMIGFTAIAQTTTCTNIILNGDFESGSGGWNEEAKDGNSPGINILFEPLINNVMPRNGTMSAEMGDYGGTNTQTGPVYTTSINKNVLPQNDSDVTLTFWLKFDACHSSNDTFILYINDNSELALNGGDAFCSDGLWHEYIIDLTPYVGGAINIKFETKETTDGSGGPTRIYIDDIVVEECITETVECDPVPAVLFGTETGVKSYITDNNMLSFQTIASTANVVYDSEGSICLGGSGQMFEVQLGGEFTILNNGCTTNFSGNQNNLSIKETNQVTTENQVQILNKQ